MFNDQCSITGTPLKMNIEHCPKGLLWRELIIEHFFCNQRITKLNNDCRIMLNRITERTRVPFALLRVNCNGSPIVVLRLATQ